MSNGIDTRDAPSAGESERETEGWYGADRPDAVGEPIPVARKKALLRILARRAAERANIRPTETDIQAMSEQFRQSFGLDDADALATWLAAGGLTPEAYRTAMRDFAIVRLVEEHFAGEIDELVREQVALSTARYRPGEPG